VEVLEQKKKKKKEVKTNKNTKKGREMGGGARNGFNYL
jgi:hypothetical protein